MVGTLSVLLWICILAPFVFLTYHRARSRRLQVARLKETGFKIDHVLHGKNVVMALSESQKKVAFLFRNNLTKVYDFSTLRSWEHTWVSRNGQRVENVLNIVVRDAQLPLVKVQGLLAAEAELWHARLSALLG